MAICGVWGAASLGGCNRIDDTSVLKDSYEVTDVGRAIEKGRTSGSGASTLIMDVRTPEKYAEGHIPGAKNIRLPQIDPKERDPDIDKYGEIIVYDQNRGSASGMAVSKRMLMVEYDDVHLFVEGFDAWKAAGLPVETGSKPVKK